MRENMGLYRGKRKDNGEWVESHGISRGRPDENTGYKYYLGSGSGAIVGTNEAGNIVRLETKADCLYYEVDPDTVGEYIGRDDMHGSKIFEGDILAYITNDGTRYYSAVKYGKFNCTCCDGVYGWYLDGGDIRDLDISDGSTLRVEIAGNIHDNPELLEVCRER